MLPCLLQNLFLVPKPENCGLILTIPFLPSWSPRVTTVPTVFVSDFYHITWLLASVLKNTHRISHHIIFNHTVTTFLTDNTCDNNFLRYREAK